MMNGFELDDEKVRSEINEGVEDYQNEKDQVSWDIPLSADDVASVEPGEIFVREGWKITPEGNIATAIELIKTVKNEVFIVDTLSYEQLHDIIKEAEEQKIEDAVEVEDTVEVKETLEVNVNSQTTQDDEFEEVDSFSGEKEPQEEDEEFDEEEILVEKIFDEDEVLEEELYEVDEEDEVPVIDNTEIPIEPVVPNETEIPVDTKEETEETEEPEEPKKEEDVIVDTKPEEPTETPSEPIEEASEPEVPQTPNEPVNNDTPEETLEETLEEEEKKYIVNIESFNYIIPLGGMKGPVYSIELSESSIKTILEFGEPVNTILPNGKRFYLYTDINGNLITE